MKKNYILIFLIFLTSVSTLVNAQKLPVKLGLRVAPSIDWMNPGTQGYTYNGVKPGITIGFISDIYFAERYAFSTGFDFSFLNGKLSYSDAVLLPADGKVHNGEVERKYNFIYFQIPLLIKMKTQDFGKFSIYGQFGFGTGFRLKATAQDIFTPDSLVSTNLDYNLTTGSTLIRESIIVGIGTEYQVDKSSRIILGINYSNSLNNILTGKNSKSKEDIHSSLNYIEVNLGFLF